ncbi:MAG: hypothetical protein IKM13_09075 [Clostridia bacterium]|nr:hypothetical protein [Clostridia bacterium]
MYTFAHLEALHREMDQYYATYDPKTEEWCSVIDGIMTRDPAESPYLRRAAIIDTMCDSAPVHIFRHTPLFFEIAAGRPRYSWGGNGVPFHRTTEAKWLHPYRDAQAGDQKEGFMLNWNMPVGLDHHCPNYDVLLEKGVLGIIRDAEAKLAAEADPKKQAFYQAVIASNKALCRLAKRFSVEAANLAAQATDPESAAHYSEIAATAARIPANPPATFREALNAILFYREVVGSVEGIGISTFAQLDRLLGPYYQADLKAGRITKEEAHTLLCELLVYTDTRFSSYSNEFHETSTTIELGGCDREGNIIYNDVTRLIFDAAVETRNLNTKLNCRISKAHPREYLEEIAKLQLIPLSCLMMHNDDVLIPARVKQGQDVKDARLYVGCGCHEVVLSGSEVCTRADTWINLPRILLAVLEKAEYESFDDFYTALIGAIGAYHERVAALKNQGEAHWAEFAPMPLYSSTFPTSLEKGLDVSEGGAKYNTTSLSMLGTATLVDSAYAVKRLVFDDKALTQGELLAHLASNFENAASLRHHILRDLPKHGTNDPELNEFSAKLLSDIATLSGQTNARGGKYLPAFYPHDIYRGLGARTGATPDGRLAGESLSRGVSPSEFIITSPLDLVGSLGPIDFTAYAESFCAELTLPNLAPTPENEQNLVAIIQAFLEMEGSSLQFNLLSSEELMDARVHPEAHPNLTVRVCGYSAKFTSLAPDVQDEILARAIR